MNRCNPVAEPLQALPSVGVARTPYYVRGCPVATHSATPAVATPDATHQGEGDGMGSFSHSDRLAETRKYRIELEAKRAAKDGLPRGDACPWPYHTQEGQHWTAVFLLAGGKLK